MPNIIDIAYKCQNCGFEPKEPKTMLCPICNGDLIGHGPGVTNTRDNFGIGRKFYHKYEDGKTREITNYKEWENAGYKDPMNSPNLTSEVKSGIKEKLRKIKYEKRKRFSVKV